jgi:hypothetical protein
MEAKVAAPDKRVGLRKESMVYLWIVPAKVAGAWDVEIGTRRLALTLAQDFQRVSGTVGERPLAAGALRGEDLRLALPAGAYGPGPVELVGRVTGDRFEGRVVGDGLEAGGFTARRRSPAAPG